MKSYQWAIIGAGPAGIAALGKLLDAGVKPEEIVWIDSHFAVGDFGMFWRNVPSNTKVSLFTRFLQACQSFEYEKCTEDFALSKADPDKTCRLGLMADPLTWVTSQLRKKVFSVEDYAESLALHDRKWHIKFRKHAELAASNV